MTDHATEVTGKKRTGKLPADPVAAIGIAAYGAELRGGSMTAEATTRAYLERIALLDGRLQAFVHVAAEQALEQARAMDRLLASGTDLGPLMGVPVAVKDLFSVSGMPASRCGSRVDLSDIVEPEGEFVRRLKRAGCVLLGKTRMTEFAFGLVNLSHPTPWNPCESMTHLLPGGSSSGSAVAMAAGLCAFSIGTDTGGSVRQPAALCGIFGHKTTAGLWPTDGVFPLSTTLDSIGYFARSARDGALIFSALSDRPAPAPRHARGLRLGKPVNHYFDDLGREVAAATERALEQLEKSGVEIVPIDVSEAAEVGGVFLPLVSVELIATIGAERFRSLKGLLDPIVWNRAEPVLEYLASDYVLRRRRQQALCAIAIERMRGLDGWITPTTPDVPLPRAGLETLEQAAAWTARGTHNTRPGNMFGQCGASIPISGAALPVGLQVMCRPGDDEALVSICQGLERALGSPPQNDMSAFLRSGRTGGPTAL
jgi:aspartyl-tRNA(Asn)/glutamyl-tRNA(Gln) amidotransferase subunit A